MALRTTKHSRSGTDNLLGQVIAGRYRLETRLGEGGMGVVFRARHVLIDRVVALKLIRPDLRGETHLRAWMLREAKAANRVDHAHIVEIHDIGETDQGDLYLVMEHLTGTALSSEIAKGPLPIPRAVDILEQMCAALTRAHDLGVVHRDLKSDNIMLTVKGGRRDFVKILDFGLAAIARDARLAPKGAVFGTPEYMSPEQARGEDATSHSDLYALGILFFEMLTGRLPFRSSDRETLLEMQRSGLAPQVAEFRTGVPDAAEQLIQRLLQKEPHKRFRDGHHLQDELKSLQRSLPMVPWEVERSDLPVAGPPAPPARSSSVSEWGTRAANFLRLVARAYPNGKAPSDISSAADKAWNLAALAARLEGEVSSHSKRLETIERRGRGLRAEIGRKVEELSQDRSRTLRDAAADKERIERLKQRLGEQRLVWEDAQRQAKLAEMSARPLNSVRSTFEEAGAAAARVTLLTEQISEIERSVAEQEQLGNELAKQINGLRAQLQRYSEALEGDLNAGRTRIATRVGTGLAYEREFHACSEALMQHLRSRPECRELLQEIDKEGRASNLMQQGISPSSDSDKTLDADTDEHASLSHAISAQRASRH